MKKKIVISVFAIIFIALICFLISNFIKNNNKSLNETVSQALNEAVSQALILECKKYSDGECPAEGHIILGTKEDENVLKVYTLTMIGNYGFENGNFVKVYGTGTIPMVFNFEKINNEYRLIDYKEPIDGAYNLESKKEMFPVIYYPRVLGYNESDNKKLKKQERKYAEDYLKKIGREAKIGSHSDFEYVSSTDLGVSVDVSNKLIDYTYRGYPLHIGTCEQIENGVRYVYEREYDKSKNEIRFKKYNYETKEVIELIRVNSVTGELIK